MNILIAEPMAPAAIELFRNQAGFNVIVSSPKEYIKHLAEADALVVRSAVLVTKEVLEQAPKLRIIGRAGVGVDNVDLEAATAAGVLVMNTPGGNAVSVAEHTVALMLSMARFIPQATASTKSGKWEKKKFLGSELRGKTLGIIGLGSIGREVVKRARAFEMRIVAYDPYVTSQLARDLGVELADLKTLYGRSDYISLHVSLTLDTERMINREALAQMKQGVRIVNCARGELIDDAALEEAIAAGKVAGAALDVFSAEPPDAGYPLFQHASVVATPHIGGSTEEAQEIVGIRIVEQMVEYLKNGVAINAVNMPALTPEQYRTIGPFITLAERLGNFASQIAGDNPKSVRLTYAGKIAAINTNLIRNAALAGMINRAVSRRANLVNSLQLAARRGWDITEAHETRSGHSDSVRVDIETDAGRTFVEGAVVLDQPRIIQIDGTYLEAPFTQHMMFLKNNDVPGVIGFVGSVLGRNQVNIANFSLGRLAKPSKEGEPLEALAVVSTDGAVGDAVLEELHKNDAIQVAKAVEYLA